MSAPYNLERWAPTLPSLHCLPAGSVEIRCCSVMGPAYAVKMLCCQDVCLNHMLARISLCIADHCTVGPIM